jgi:hypothetical protein
MSDYITGTWHGKCEWFPYIAEEESPAEQRISRQLHIRTAKIPFIPQYEWERKYMGDIQVKHPNTVERQARKLALQCRIQLEIRIIRAMAKRSGWVRKIHGKIHGADSHNWCPEGLVDSEVADEWIADFHAMPKHEQIEVLT